MDCLPRFFFEEKRQWEKETFEVFFMGMKVIIEKIADLNFKKVIIDCNGLKTFFIVPSNGDYAKAFSTIYGNYRFERTGVNIEIMEFDKQTGDYICIRPIEITQRSKVSLLKRVFASIKRLMR